jgi:hypothetical protein
MKLFAVLCVLAMTLAASAQDYPKAEIFGGYNYASSDVTSPGRTHLNGWNGAATANINRWFGVKADFSGLYGSKSVGNILGAPCPPFCNAVKCAHIFIHSYSDHSSPIEQTSSRLLHTPFLASVTQVSVLRYRLQACRDSIRVIRYEFCDGSGRRCGLQLPSPAGVAGWSRLPADAIVRLDPQQFPGSDGNRLPFLSGRSRMREGKKRAQPALARTSITAVRDKTPWASTACKTSLKGSYCRAEYSALACLRMGTSGSASFQVAKKS